MNKCITCSQPLPESPTWIAQWETVSSVPFDPPELINSGVVMFWVCLHCGAITEVDDPKHLENLRAIAWLDKRDAEHLSQYMLETGWITEVI